MWGDFMRQKPWRLPRKSKSGEKKENSRWSIVDANVEKWAKRRCMAGQSLRRSSPEAQEE